MENLLVIMQVDIQVFISWMKSLNFGDNSDNVIAIFTDPSHYEGWWYEGGGIYRNVHFYVKELTYLFTIF